MIREERRIVYVESGAGHGIRMVLDFENDCVELYPTKNYKGKESNYFQFSFSKPITIRELGKLFVEAADYAEIQLGLYQRDKNVGKD